MVSQQIIECHAPLLRSLSNTSDKKVLKNIIVETKPRGLRVLVALIKDFLCEKIPLELDPEERKKLNSYKKKLRAIVDMKLVKETR